MSIEEVDRKIRLLTRQIFDHSKILRQEIESFRDAFERNERFKELDGLIRKNHQIYEVNEADCIPLLQSSTLSTLNKRMSRIAVRLELLSKAHFSEATLRDIDLLALTQSDILRLSEAELLKSNPILDGMDNMDDHHLTYAANDVTDTAVRLN